MVNPLHLATANTLSLIHISQMKLLNRKNIIIFVAIIIAYILGKLLIDVGIVDTYIQLNLVLIGINIILAVSLNLITGYTGQLSLGHAAFMSVGAYTSGIMTAKFGQPFIVGVLAAALFAALASIIIGIPTLRLKGDYLAIATLGFGAVSYTHLKQIEMVKVDNKSDSAEAANVSTRLITRDNVVAILGPATSGNTKGGLPPAMQHKVPLISASATADDVTVDSNGNVREYVFKTCFSDSYQGVTMANFAYNDLEFKNAAILMDNTSDYAKGLAAAFKETFTELGGSLTAEEAYAAKETDFRTVLTNIKGSNPEVVYLPGYYEEVGLIVKQARELGLNVPFLGGDGYDSPKLVEIAGAENLNQVFYTNHYSPQDDACLLYTSRCV